MKNLIIDPEFRDKIPPLSEDEFSKLEENIVSDGEVREPLVVWNNTIIDGHHRWKIIQKHPEIPYRIKDMDFADKWAAIVWMCRNQLGRRNLTEPQKMVLVADQFEAQKKTVGAPEGNKNAQKQCHQNDGIEKRSRGTAEIIAKDSGLSTSYVERAVQFSKGLNEANKVSPGIKEAILTGEVKAAKKVIADIRKMPEEKKVEVVEAIKRGETVYPDYVPMKNATPVEQRPAYNTDDFEAELNAIISSLDKSLKTTMVLVHRDMLNEKLGIKVANKVLVSAREVISKYENMVKEIEYNAESI